MRNKVRWIRPCRECYVVAACENESHEEVNKARRASSNKEIKDVATKMATKFPQRRFVPGVGGRDGYDGGIPMPIPAEIPENTETNVAQQLQQAISFNEDMHRKWTKEGYAPLQ